MQMQTAAGGHRTTSLNAASFLLALGFPLSDATRGSDGRVEFVIDGPHDEIASKLHEFRTGRATVNALAFTEALRRLKAIVHDLD